MEEDAKGLEKMASKEVLLQEKIQESLDKIAALGTLPNAPDLQHKYQKMSLKQVPIQNTIYILPEITFNVLLRRK